MNNNRCIKCGNIIPEGLQICINCENNGDNKQIESKEKYEKCETIALYLSKNTNCIAPSRLARDIYKILLPGNSVIITREEFEEFNSKIHKLQEQNTILNNQLAELEADFLEKCQKSS